MASIQGKFARYTVRSLCACALVVFPACVKTYKIMKQESPQGVVHEPNFLSVQKNLRSVRVYDEWATKASFDALYLSDEIRRLSASIYSRRRGKDHEFERNYARRQLEENKQWLSFYVLADVRASIGRQLNDQDPAWTAYLETISGQKIPAMLVKDVELSPEIRGLFSAHENSFKTPYLIQFSATDDEGKRIVEQDAPFKLVMSSFDRDAEMFWGDHPDLASDKSKYPARVRVKKDVTSKKVGPDEDYYWW